MDGGIMAENYNGMAVGIFELDSFAACFVALDAASKAANVKIQNIERNLSLIHISHHMEVQLHLLPSPKQDAMPETPEK